MLKELRIEKNLSQYQLSEKLNISQSAIAKWELNKTEPTASYIIKLADFFDVTTDFILGLDYQIKSKENIKPSEHFYDGIEKYYNEGIAELTKEGQKRQKL